MEAPDRFRAIQTYRAAMAIISQQRQFIMRMFNAAVLTEAEKEIMEEVRIADCNTDLSLDLH
jgi:hypothetical protein